MNNSEKIYNMASCMLSILDSLKLYDNNSLDVSDETLSEVMWRKMKAYNIDLNKELGFDHLKPVSKINKKNMFIVGKVIHFETKHWEFAGIYSTEEKAVERCIDENHFLAEVKLDEYIPDETVQFEYAYYPKI